MTARRIWLVSGTLVVVAGAGVAAAASAGVFSSQAAAGTTGSQYHTATSTVTRQSLTSQTQVDATLERAGSYTVVNQASGTVTAMPAPGKVVHQGQTLYQVSGEPVILLYGNVPDWRDLSAGVTGPDVTQLNHDLVALGYADSADIATLGWGYFSWETRSALEQLQQHLGSEETGTLSLGQAVFLPSAAEITGTDAVPGNAATPGSDILTASSVNPVVTVDLDATDQSYVKDGDRVTVTLPGGDSTSGVVSSISNVSSPASTSTSSPSPSSSSPSGSGGTGTSPGGSGSSSGASGSSGPNNSSSSSATVTVEVTFTNPKAAGNLNNAPVTVTITTGSVSSALVVPVSALQAQTGGGYAVQVAGRSGSHHLVPVELGLFDDAAGLVQVSGPGLAAGQEVVVPST